jgi:hypothetical protein
MSLPKPDLHIRISPDAKAMLGLLAEVQQAPESVVAAQILERAILGEGHVLKVAARQLHRAGIMGSDGDA